MSQMMLKNTLQSVSQFFNRHRMLRGMVAYSVLWPVGSMVQQTVAEGKHFPDYDWNKILRFCLYGTLIQGPALYCWIRIANKMWPRNDIRSSLAKAFTEQFAFDPFSITSFLYTMSILENKTSEQAKEEVASKFLSIYAIGFVYWPIAQTINFACVSPRNQVIYVSVASLIWTTFLAIMKGYQVEGGESPILSTLKPKPSVKRQRQIEMQQQQQHQQQQLQ